jgi:hypothetical protein
VISYLDVVALSDVSFVVRPGGRNRVLKEKRKNVHAFAVGTLSDDIILHQKSCRFYAVYNPYKAAYFRLTNGDRIDSVPLALMDEKGLRVCL